MRIEKVPFDRVLGNPSDTVYLIEGSDLDPSHEVREPIPDILANDPDSTITLYTIHTLGSLNNFPKVVEGDVDLSRSKITNLFGIGKTWITQCEWLFLPPDIKSHILGLLLIKGLIGVCIVYSRNGYQANRNFFLAIDIVNECIDRGIDMLDCQEMLIDAGLREFGQL